MADADAARLFCELKCGCETFTFAGICVDGKDTAEVIDRLLIKRDGKQCCGFWLWFMNGNYNQWGSDSLQKVPIGLIISLWKNRHRICD